MDTPRRITSPTTPQARRPTRGRGDLAALIDDRPRSNPAAGTPWPCYFNRLTGRRTHVRRKGVSSRPGFANADRPDNRHRRGDFLAHRDQVRDHRHDTATRIGCFRAPASSALVGRRILPVDQLAVNQDDMRMHLNREIGSLAGLRRLTRWQPVDEEHDSSGASARRK